MNQRMCLYFYLPLVVHFGVFINSESTSRRVRSDVEEVDREIFGFGTVTEINE